MNIHWVIKQRSHLDKIPEKTTLLGRTVNYFEREICSYVHLRNVLFLFVCFINNIASEFVKNCETFKPHCLEMLNKTNWVKCTSRLSTSSLSELTQTEPPYRGEPNQQDKDATLCIPIL